MQSVMNVIMNRAAKLHTTPYEECVRKLQFSSITAPHDPQLTNWPCVTDPAWQKALLLAAQACGAGGLTDITDGALNYYALSMTEPPSWAAAMIQTVDIAGQRFFR